MDAVILAAGEGSRMGELSGNQPKLFLKINGYYLYEHQIARLDPHCDRITIVLGHGFEDCKCPIESFDLSRIDITSEIEIITIEKWRKYENGYSALKALENANSTDIMLVCGDVIFTQSCIDDIVEGFYDSIKSNSNSAVGVIEGLQDEMTGVKWDNQNMITEYGAIESHQEVGIFILNRHYIDESIELLKRNKNDWFPIIFTRCPTNPIRVAEKQRHEINTPEHLLEAREKWSEMSEQLLKM